MKTVTVEVTKIRCLRCGHEWVPRKPIGEVRMCPNCKTAYFDVPRKVDRG